MGPGILELLGRQRDQRIDLLGRVISPGQVGFADLSVALSRFRQPIERHAHTHEPPMGVLIPPLDLDPCPRFLNRIHRS